jgi:hypothetical protein
VTAQARNLFHWNVSSFMSYNFHRKVLTNWGDDDDDVRVPQNTVWKFVSILLVNGEVTQISPKAS